MTSKMPNWCHNIASFHHNDTIMIQKLLHGAEHGLLQEFIPHQKHHNPNWCVENWGTKWEAKDTTINKKDTNTIELSFNTAWSPPINFYKTMINNGFEIKAVYKESGLMFIGQFINGDDEIFLLDYDNFMKLPQFILHHYKKEIIEEKEFRFCSDDLK